MKLSRGIVSIPVVVGLVLMAVAMPFAGKLALNNQDNRNRAAGAHPSNCICIGGRYENEGGTCAFVDERCSMGNVVPTGPVRCISDKSCGTNQRCVSGKCAVDKCTFDLECLNGRCAAGTCIYVSVPTQNPIIGSSCLIDKTCGSGYHCVNFKCQVDLPVNSSCVNDSDCASKKCSGIVPNRKCVPPVKTPNGGVCTWDSDCRSGYCTGVGSARKCMVKRANGSTCTIDNDCSSSHCIGNYPNRKCAAYENYRPVGANCLTNSVCNSGSCILGKCKKTNCVMDKDCGTGHICTTDEGCVNSTSRNRPSGSGCSKNINCASNSCVGGKCAN